jgi:VanZ family protein
VSRSQLRWLLFLVALAVQLVALYAPRTPSEGSGWGLDKVVHAGLFAVVVWTGRRAGLPPVWLVLLCALHGPVSELVQAHFLPHRDGTVGDALADLTGTAIGALLPIRRRGPTTGRMEQ